MATCSSCGPSEALPSIDFPPAGEFKLYRGTTFVRPARTFAEAEREVRRTGVELHMPDGTVIRREDLAALAVPNELKPVVEPPKLRVGVPDVKPQRNRRAAAKEAPVPDPVAPVEPPAPAVADAMSALFPTAAPVEPAPAPTSDEDAELAELQRQLDEIDAAEAAAGNTTPD